MYNVGEWLLTMSITYILLCISAGLLFFYLRRWEAKEKSCPNYIPDYGLTQDLVARVPSVIEQNGRKATTHFSCPCALPDSVRSFFSVCQNFCLDVDGVVLDRKFTEVPYSENADYLQIGTLSYGEDVILVRKDRSDENIYIVGCEDDNPANPEIYATCFTNFIAMCIGQYLEKGQEADTKEAQCP